MSRPRKGEPINQDLSDIEDGAIKPNCYSCRKKQNVHRKYMTVVNDAGEKSLQKTYNYMGVCTNPLCHRYSDPKNIPSWVREDKVKQL